MFQYLMQQAQVISPKQKNNFSIHFFFFLFLFLLTQATTGEHGSPIPHPTTSPSPGPSPGSSAGGLPSMFPTLQQSLSGQQGAPNMMNPPPATSDGVVLNAAFQAVMNSLSDVNPTPIEHLMNMITTHIPPSDPTAVDGKCCTHAECGEIDLMFFFSHFLL
jgi:predicted component of type VI protein secretion system